MGTTGGGDAGDNDISGVSGSSSGHPQNQNLFRQRLRSKGQHHLHRRRKMRSSRHTEHQLRRRIIVTNIVVCAVFLFAVVLVVHRAKHPLARMSFRSSRRNVVTSSLLEPQQQQQQQHHPPQQQQQQQHSRKSQQQKSAVIYDFVCKNHPDIKGVLNDDYCDCPDGSDETTTSACSHLLVGKRVFSCGSKGGGGGEGDGDGVVSLVPEGRRLHAPRKGRHARDQVNSSGPSAVFASRVRDGVIDCDSGNDETPIMLP